MPGMCGGRRGNPRRWYLENKTMQVNCPSYSSRYPIRLVLQPIAPPVSEQRSNVVLLSLESECPGCALLRLGLTGLRPVCGRVARRQKFYLEPSIGTAVGGLFILRFSRRILCLAAMLARLVLRSLGEGGWESSTLG